MKCITSVREVYDHENMLLGNRRVNKSVAL